MATDNATRKAAETDVIGAFKRYGFWAIAVPALVVAIAVGGMMRNIVVRDFGQVFASGMNGIVSEAFDDSSWDQPADSAAVEHFAEMIDDRIDNDLVGGVRIQKTDGLVVYSTDAEEIGTVLELDAAARRALDTGSVTSRVVDSHTLLGDRAEEDLLVVGPITIEGAAGVSGVMTALKPYGAIQPSVRASVGTVVALVVLGALVAFTFLRLLIVRAERELASSRARVEQVNERLGQSLTDMERHFIGTLEALNAAVDAKDRYTARHSLHVADYACALGVRLELDSEIRTLERAGLLHDIGKIGVPESILQNPGRLTEAEYRVVRDHSRVGAKIIETVPSLGEVVPVVQSHHEWWNGNGYPDGLAGEEIPRLARVLAVADAFDAMTTDRPYRQAVTIAHARAELIKGRDVQFDPQIVDAFVEMIDTGAVVVADARTAPLPARAVATTRSASTQ